MKRDRRLVKARPETRYARFLVGVDPVGGT